MLLTSKIIKNKYINYSNKDMKLSRDVKINKIYKIINGLYETNPNTPSYLLAGCIYGPSYISFDYALSYYGLIPERVNVITNATRGKKKKKIFNTSFGVFKYCDVPSLAYPEFVNLIEENGYSYQIATCEKALCDKLYSLKRIKNLSDLEVMLFSDLRIDIIEFNKLNVDNIKYLSTLYGSFNVKLLYRYMRRNVK